MFRLPRQLVSSRNVGSLSKTFVRRQSSSSTSAPVAQKRGPTPLQQGLPPTTEELVEKEPADVLNEQQAPNRALTWAKSQRPRKEAMVGPRFEQTDMDVQPRPMSAIALIHEQPVRFIPARVAVCDGGGGPLGHPKVFINVDKPEIVPCGYCGLPYAHIHHKEHIRNNNPEFPVAD